MEKCLFISEHNLMATSYVGRFNMNDLCLPKEGFVKLKLVLQLVPVSRSAWYEGQKSGIFPSSVKIGKRSSAYSVDDIRTLIEKISNGELLLKLPR